MSLWINTTSRIRTFCSVGQLSVRNDVFFLLLRVLTTKITLDDGEAVLLVDSVGKSTVYGQLAAELCAQLEDRESPLQFKLNALAEQISKLGYIMATFIAVSYLFKQIVMDNHWSWTEIST
jgi:magnesium-transporting ATPase (P-type)